MAPHSSAPRRSGLASRSHALLHWLAVALGWAVFAACWWLVLGRPWEQGALRALIVGAAVVMPLITVAWIVHNRRIYRRLGPRRAVPMVPLRYEVDFNGRRIEADWPALQQARFIVIERDEGVKRYRARAPSWPESTPVDRLPTVPAAPVGEGAT